MAHATRRPLAMPLTLLALAVLLSVRTESPRAESLIQLWEHVVESNPTQKSSEHAVEQARAQQDQVLAKLLPNAAIKGFYSYNSLNNSVNTNGFNLFSGNNKEYGGYNGNITISQALFDLPSYLRLQGANKQTQQQEASALAQRMEIAYKMLDQYLAILETDDLIAQLDAELEATQAQITRLQHMHESQLAKVTDLYEVEAFGQSLETSRIEANHQRAIFSEKLREITGVPVHNPDRLVENNFPEMQRSADEWVEEALTSNPMLLSLQYAAESAQQMIQSAHAEHLPTASVSASETIANTIYNNLQTNGLDSYNIGSLYLNVNIPLFSGGGTEAGVRESVQRYQISREKIEEVRRSIEREVRTSWFNIDSGRSRIASTLREVGFREKAKIAQTTSYSIGTTTIVDLLDSHKKLLKARTEYQKARYDYIRSLIRLRMNAGSLADLDIESISPWFAPVAPPETHHPKAPLPRKISSESRPQPAPHHP